MRLGCSRRREPVRAGRPLAVAAGGRVVGTASLLLWEVLEAAYALLGFDAVGDEEPGADWTECTQSPAVLASQHAIGRVQAPVLNRALNTGTLAT
jgi:hypothetical protein